MKLISDEEMDQILNIRVLRLASKLSLIFQRETLRPVGVKIQQWRILVSLAHFGKCHLRKLARLSSQDPAHTSRVVKAMISAGWVAGRPDDGDQRRIQFNLTKAGENLVKMIWPEAKKLAEDIAELFDENEFEQFKGLLDKANLFCDARLNSEADSSK